MTRITAVAMLAAILAIVVRLPVCGESLWVDELHSAWTIWGDWQEIPERAALGNQTRWYFYALWGWRQLAGDSEIALRLPSVLATALAAAVLVVAVARHGGGLIGGAIAGLLLAMEVNAIFFGTETRPYAGVMLAVACAAWAGLELRRGAGGRGRWVARVGLLSACFAGFLWHATAALPLAILATVLFVWPPSLLWPRHRRNPQRSAPAPEAGFTAGDYAAVVVVMGLALWINADVIFRVWSDRSQWSAFGRPRSFGELWTMWPWIWLVGLPVSCWAAVRLLAWRSADADRTAEASASSLAAGGCVNRIRAEGISASFRAKADKASANGVSAPFGLGTSAAVGAAAPLLVAALLTTAVAWAVSVWGIAPIWHRRFLIGTLPLLCLAAGGFWGSSVEVCVTSVRSRRRPPQVGGQGALRRWGLRAVVLVVAVGGLMRSQGTMGQLFAGTPVLVRRGEDWRGAVAYLERRRGLSEPVLVAAELLESVALDAQPSEARDRSAAARGASQREAGAEMLHYLRYPVAGPYAVPGAAPLGRQPEPLRWRIVDALHSLTTGPPRQPGQAPASVWVLLRTDRSAALARIGAREAGAREAGAGESEADWTRAGETGASEMGAGTSAMISQLSESIAARSFGGITLVQIVAASEPQ